MKSAMHCVVVGLDQRAPLGVQLQIAQGMVRPKVEGSRAGSALTECGDGPVAAHKHLSGLSRREQGFWIVKHYVLAAWHDGRARIGDEPACTHEADRAIAQPLCQRCINVLAGNREQLPDVESIERASRGTHVQIESPCCIEEAADERKEQQALNKQAHAVGHGILRLHQARVDAAEDQDHDVDCIEPRCQCVLRDQHIRLIAALAKPRDEQDEQDHRRQ